LRNLLGALVTDQRPFKTKKRQTKVAEQLGCAACPLDKIQGLNKVINIDRIRGKRVMLWAQSPGARENEEGLELVGASGQLLWKELLPYGIERKHVDLQNVIRCRPLGIDGIEHTPTKKELRCCSVYNTEALLKNDGKACVHVILGKVAADQLLPKVKRTGSIFWHEQWNAYVVLVDHPSFILRSGGTKAGWIYYKLRDQFRAVRTILDHPGRWGYVKAQNYGAVSDMRQMAELKQTIYKEAKTGRRVGVDFEDGIVDGKHVVLSVAFSWGVLDNDGVFKGGARSVVLNHPQAKHVPGVLPKLLSEIKAILSDGAVRKVLQHGSSDCTDSLELLGCQIEGYDYDVQYATYLKHPHLRSYSLNSIANNFFPEFGDYKTMATPYHGNFALMPLDLLVTYNCADADLTKRAELKTSTGMNMPLLQVYIRVAFTLARMEKVGPIVDAENLARAEKLIPDEIKKIDHKLRVIAGRADFDPGKNQQVAWLLFDKLKLPKPIDKRGVETRSTAKGVLETLTLTQKSAAPKLMTMKRKLEKIRTTYISGYKRALQTPRRMILSYWWLTGAVTGRLRSSGRDEEGVDKGGMNLQNLHGNSFIKNILVSDPNWRIAYDGNSKQTDK